MVKEPTDYTQMRRALRLIDSVLELPQDERSQTLDSACGLDTQLRAQVDRLLAIVEQLDTREWNLVEERLPLEISHAPPPPEPGVWVGGYRLGRLLAKGGMGSVYEAEQESPRRAVALKLLNTGFGSEDFERRFKSESEILARLRHPAIAQIYDAGIHRDGNPSNPREIPYFALELVPHARTITDYVAENELARGEVLELFRQVCEAVHHGHQRGVIHRDIKPANVLVDGTGRPKVIDFGVARVFDPEVAGFEARTLETQAGQILGTLPYMSPEQFSFDSHDVDIRTDVYALGVLLYELLCGRLPFQVARMSLPQVIQVLENTPPDPPRSVRADLETDLENIVLKALSKEREDRYASAAELARDLQRFLRHEPVEARPTTRWHRAKLFARRNPGLTGALAVAAGALMLAAITSTAFGLRTKRAVHAKERQIEVASQALAGETAALRRAEAALAGETAALERATETQSHLLEFGSSVIYGLVSDFSHMGQPASARAEAVRTAIQHIDELAAQVGEDVDTLAFLSGAHLRLGDVLGHPGQSNLGDVEAARASYDKATEAAERVAALDPDHFEGRRLEARIALRRGDLARFAMAHDEALEQYERSVQVSEELLEIEPDNPKVHSGLAAALSSLGTLKGMGGQHAEALAHFERAREATARTVELDPEEPHHLRNLSGMHTKVAMSQGALGRNDDALASYEDSITIVQDLLKDAPEDPVLEGSLAQTYCAMTELMTRLERFSEADDYASRAIALMTTLIDRDPGNHRVRRNRIFGALYRAQCNQAWAKELAQAGSASEEQIDKARSDYESVLADFAWLRKTGEPPAAFLQFEEAARAGLQAVSGDIEQ